MLFFEFLLPILGYTNGLNAHCKIACLCFFLQFRSSGSQFFLIAATWRLKFLHLLIWISSIWGMRLPFENLQYHWNHPSGSSLKIHPFSIQCFRDRPDLTLNRFRFTSKFLLIFALTNQDFGYSFILSPKYEPPNTPPEAKFARSY